MVISYYLSTSDNHVRQCNNVRIVYTKTRSRFAHYRICGRFFSLLMSNAASQAKLQSLQLYCICMCQVNSTTGSDGWLQQCVAIPSLHGAGGSFASFKREEKNRREWRAEQEEDGLPLLLVLPFVKSSRDFPSFPICGGAWEPSVKEATSRDGPWKPSAPLEKPAGSD